MAQAVSAVAGAVNSTRGWLFLLLALGFAIADLWHFKALDTQTDLGLIYAALAGAGVGVAHTAGVSAALSPPPGPPTPPQA